MYQRMPLARNLLHNTHHFLFFFPCEDTGHDGRDVSCVQFGIAFFEEIVPFVYELACELVFDDTSHGALRIREKEKRKDASTLLYPRFSKCQA